MAAARFEEVAEQRERRVDGVEQPETGDIRGREIGQALILLPPQAGYGAGTCVEDFHQTPRDRDQVIAGVEIEQRRHEGRVQLEGAGLGAPHARRAQRGIAVARFAFAKQAKVLVRHLHRFFREAGGFVAEELNLRAVARAALTRRPFHVEAALTVLGNGQIEIERGLVRLETIGQQLWRRRGVGAGYVKHQAVGKNPGGARNTERAAGQLLLADLHLGETPRAEREVIQVELEQVFKKAVLKLKVLGAQECPLGPDYRLQSFHCQSQYQN